MSGVLFIVTIPTERHERQQEQSKNTTFNNETADKSSEQPFDSFNSENLVPKDVSSVSIDIDGPLSPENVPSSSSERGNIQKPHRSTPETEPVSKIQSHSPKNGAMMEELPNRIDDLLDIETNSSMERIMTELLLKLGINNAVWHLSRNTNFFQITFVMESNYRHEMVINVLNDWGIGQRHGSSMSMIPCALHNELDDRIGSNSEEKSVYDQKQTAWNRFMNSIRARWNVAQIVQKVRQDATLTFDFVTLVMVAGTLASFGLVENSTIFLASSMLISPLMGPIIATIFGIVIKDNSLIRFGIINETIGILLATAVGFFFGLIISFIDSKYEFGYEQVLTPEMIDRCKFHSLLIGVFTAIPSGAAVAIAILGENIGSLVGVAISASLLPPAVNSGVLWSLAVLYMVHADDETRFNNIVTTSHYSNNQAIELFVYGSISLLLTLINIICILGMGVIILKIKEVAPITTRSQKQLWKYDIKIARNFNKTNSSEDDRMTRRLADDFTELDMSDEMMRSLYNTWSPMTMQQQSPSKPAINDLERVYMHLAAPPNQQTWNRSMLFNNRNSTKYQSNDQISSANRRASLPYTKNKHDYPAYNAFKNKYFDNIPEINIEIPNDGSKYIGIEPLPQNGTNTLRSQKECKKFTVTPTDLDKIS